MLLLAAPLSIPKRAVDVDLPSQARASFQQVSEWQCAVRSPSERGKNSQQSPVLSKTGGELLRACAS